MHNINKKNMIYIVAFLSVHLSHFS